MTRWMTKPAARARSGSRVTTVPRMSGRSSRLCPPSWALIINAVKMVVDSSPNNAHPAQSMSALRKGVSLGGEHAEDVREGLQETCDALVLERQTHVVHVYARRCNRPHDPFGVRDIDI